MLKRVVKVCAVILTATLLMTGCGLNGEFNSTEKGVSNNAKITNNSVYTQLDFADKGEVVNAQAGFLKATDDVEIRDKNGKIIFSQKELDFISDNTPAPDSVNPSLWANTKMSKYAGLFEISQDNVYQVRGYDVTNLTAIVSDNGYIIVDPMSNEECAREAFDFLQENLGERPVKAVILTNPSVDNFGGIGVFVKDKDTQVIVAKEFEKSLENDTCFCQEMKDKLNDYEKGVGIEKSITGSISVVGTVDEDAEITISYCKPTDVIEESTTMTIDGVTLDFIINENSKTKDKMDLFLKNTGSIYLSTDVTQGLEEIYGIRKDSVCDVDATAKRLSSIIAQYGSHLQNVMQAHMYSYLYADAALDYLRSTAQFYRFVYDETVKLINKGYTKSAVQENVAIPDTLSAKWCLRQCITNVDKFIADAYDSVANNGEIDYTKINPIAETEKAKKMIEYMGGDTQIILNKAKADFDKGEYQWVCEITNAIICVDSENKNAKYLCADSLEQMAYTTESAIDRNLYLAYAKKLRNDGNEAEENGVPITKNEIASFSTEKILDLIAQRTDFNNNPDADICLNLYIEDTGERYVVIVQNNTFMYYKNNRTDVANASVQLNKGDLSSLISDDSLGNSNVKVYGDSQKFEEMKEMIKK